MATESQSNGATQSSPTRKRRPWLLLFLLLCLGLLGASLFPPRWPAAEALPKLAKDIARKCEVTRDAFGVPHIKAASFDAGAYCWGRVQALDRGWQMDFLRRRAHGRVAEVYGMKYVRDDFQMRILDLTSLADRWVANYRKKPTRIYHLLRMYAWGVNDGFAALKKAKKKPYIWMKSGYHPPPWRVRDTLVIIALQSFYQTRRTFSNDLKHARLRLKLGPVRYQQLYRFIDGLPPLSHTILKPGEHPLLPKVAQPLRRAVPKAAPSSRPVVRPASQPAVAPRPAVPAPQPVRPQPRPTTTPAVRPVPRRSMRTPRFQPTKLAGLDALMSFFAPLKGTGGGSNSWVVSPARSKSGHAMLANDPHLGILTPSFWHEVHIQAPGFDVLGIGVPGTPSIVSGNNRHVAWGITNGFSNAADLIRIKIGRKATFKLDGKTYRIRGFRPTVWIKSGRFHIPIFWKRFNRTPLGPILPIGAKPGEAILLRWTGYHIKDPSIESILAVMKSKSAKEADEGFKGFAMPCWNMVFADTKGSIGYRQVGLLAKRTKGIRGLIDGTDDAQQWKGFLSTKQMPSLLNPARGFIATANNHVFPKGFPFYIGDSYVIGHRARRIEEMILQTAKHSPETMKKIQLDLKVPMARMALPMMLKLVSRKGLTKQALAALGLLKAWDMEARRDAIGPTLFRMWYRSLETVLFAHEIVRPQNPRIRTQKSKRKKAKPYRPSDAIMLAALRGKIEIGVRQTVPQALNKALRQALAKLRKDLGPDMQKWQWGRYHKLYFFHMLGKHIKLHPAAEPTHGGVETVNPALLGGRGPFWVRNAASYRLVVELKPGRIRSWGVLAGKNIDDTPKKLGKQQRMWLDHKYRPRPFYPDEIKKYKVSHFTISF